ncbi:hypothetical protein EDD22DRAFT_909031 [Suillus occidentalis]|nr:hypothetical protein EDD22DRAFT_909031 [Suillus occidentalis]
MNKNNDSTIQVTLKYGGAKGGQLIYGTTSKAKALHVLLADLNDLRAHRPKGENIRQEGAAFFLLWSHPAHAPVPLAKDSLYRRWVAIAKGSPELNAVKKDLSILPSTGFTEIRGTDLSPLGPYHTIELPRTEEMSQPADNFPFDSIDEQSIMSPPFGSDGNDEPSNPLLKKIRTEQHLPIQSSTDEGKYTPDGFSTGEYQTTQSRCPISQALLAVTPQQPLRIPPYHTKPSVSNNSTPTGPRPPGDRRTISNLSLELSKVRSQLTTLKHCEKGISEELIRYGVSQPKSEETAPSPHGLVYQQFGMYVADLSDFL